MRGLRLPPLRTFTRRDPPTALLLLPGRPGTARADIVIRHFGTHDVRSSVVSPDRALATRTKPVTHLRASRPDVHVLVARLIPLNPTDCTVCAQPVADLDSPIPARAEATSAGPSPVTAVDQWTGCATTTDTCDGVHPRTADDEKTAARPPPPWPPSWRKASRTVPVARGTAPASPGSGTALSPRPPTARRRPPA